MLREALAVSATDDGWARLLKMFDVLVKQECLTIYLCLPLTRTKKKEQLEVIGKLRRMHRTGNTSFRDKEFVKVELILSAQIKCFLPQPRVLVVL